LAASIWGDEPEAALRRDAHNRAVHGSSAIVVKVRAGLPTPGARRPLLSGPRRLADHLIGHGGAVRAAVGVVPARLHHVLVDDGHPAVGAGKSVFTVAHRLRIG